MAETFLSKLQLKIGQLMGQTSNAKPDIVDEWKAHVHAFGDRPTERLASLMAADMQNLGSVPRQEQNVPIDSPIEEMQKENDIILQARTIINQLNKELIEKDFQFRSDTISIRNQNEQLQQLVVQRDEHLQKISNDYYALQQQLEAANAEIQRLTFVLSPLPTEQEAGQPQLPASDVGQEYIQVPITVTDYKPAKPTKKRKK